MKKKLFCAITIRKLWLRKTLWLMNHLAFLMLFAGLSVSAKVYSQEDIITLKMEDVSLVEVFNAVTGKTGYDFLFNYDLVNTKGKVSVDASDMKLNDLLNKLLQEKGLEYEFRDNTIIVRQQTDGGALEPQRQIVREAVLKGVVTDEKGVPLPGVSVCVERTNVGVATNVNGEYELAFSANQRCVIVYSFVGMKTEKYQFTGKNTVHRVVLKYEDKMLNDVVVIGYGNKEKRDLTTAVSTVNANDLVKGAGASANSFDNMLGGSVKGMIVTQNSGTPGAAATINIRGITSPLLDSPQHSANEPLFVIDGVPFFNDKNSLNPLLTLAPDDIESIDVLKDAAATSIYGSRGANGVVIVKTKSGKRSEQMTIAVGYTMSVGNPINERKPLNTSQFKEVQEMIVRNTIAAGRGDNVARWAKYGQDGQFTGLNPEKYGTNTTNWVNEVKNKNALTHQYNLSIRGGSVMTNYSFSFNATDQEGLFINDHLKRYGARLSVDSDISRRFKAGASMSYTFSQYKRGNDSPDKTWNVRPDVPVYDETGRYYRIPDANGSGELKANPVALRLGNNNESRAFQFMGSSWLEYEILDHLKLHGDINLSVFNNKDDSFKSKDGSNDLSQSIRQSPLEAILQVEDALSTYSSVNFRVDYEWSYEAHHMNAMAGYGWDRMFAESRRDGYQGFPDDHTLNDVQSAYKYLMDNKSSSKVNSGLNSVYARLGYIYGDKYLAEVNFRSDASSKFGPGNKRGYFPSVSVGWRISQENFLVESDFVNNLKLRLSWGKTGSTNLDDFSYKQFFVRNRDDYYGGSPAIGLKNILPNKDVRWEMTTEYNGGIDFTFLGHRLYGSIDAYYRFTDGALATAPAPLESGFSEYVANLVDVSNRGLEVEIGGDILRSDSWTWTSRFNISFNRNKLEKLNGANLDITQMDSYAEGKPVGILKGFAVEKIYQEGDRQEIEKEAQKAMENNSYFFIPSGPGDYKYKDADHNGYINEEDKVVVANPEPKFFGGFFNSVSWKNLNLSFMFQFTKGATAQLYFLQAASSGNMEMNLEPELYGNTWTPEHTDARYARLVNDDVYNNGMSGFFAVDRYVFSTSYLRLKNITLSYDLPRVMLTRINITGVQFFASVSNLWTLTKWPGIDPEGLAAGAIGGSASSDPYPLSKTFSVGVKVQF